jgi:hypothetical protein
MKDNKPVVWAVDYGNGIDADDVFDREDAERVAVEYPGGVIVPLYLQPHPTLTDEEREAIDRAIGWLGTIAETRGEQHSAGYLFDDAAAMRRLLDRTK